MKRVRVFISGRVQGVFFRAYTKEEAEKLGLKGWVRNLPDGRVEALFEGDEKAIEEMIKWCHIGSPASVVTKVEVVEEPYLGDLKDFSIKYL
ncbi:MAG: acylphosphatase [Caldimicrobium sp.]